MKILPDDSGSTSRPDRLEDQFSLQHLRQIMHHLLDHSAAAPSGNNLLNIWESWNHLSKQQGQVRGNMNLPDFKDMISQVLGTDEFKDEIDKLFIKLDTTGDGLVSWNEFCTHLLLLYREHSFINTTSEKPFLEEPKIRHIFHNKQEVTVKMLAVNTPLRYISISKEGGLCVWHPNMTMERQFHVCDQVQDRKRRFSTWVTDAVYMGNCQKIAIGSTSRDIRFYDVSSPQYFEEYHIFAMADVPYCFDYYYNPKLPNSESLLLFGVDTGTIHLLTFLKPVTRLFQTSFKTSGGVQKIFMQDIRSHSDWVQHRVISQLHQEVIHQLRYLPENECIISASASARTSVIMGDLHGVRQSYVYRVEKGVECFDYSKLLNLLVTGSSDHLVRLWNPYVTHSPVALLHGHATGVIGVVIYEQLRQVFSYSKDGVVKVWDSLQHTCLQTILLKFPSSLHGHVPEFGQFPVYLHTSYPYSAFLVTCGDFIANLRLGRPQENASNRETTHDSQLCCAIYNPTLKQVITGCDSSTIAVWDAETGQSSFVINDAHEGEEITCLALDASEKRLISGARNGTVKVWNVRNGHNLHNLESAGEAEVTGIVHLPDCKVILTVGWNQMIVTYDDSDVESKNIPANTSWKGGHLHRDDILSLDLAAPNFLATASYNGEINMWEADTQRLYLRLRKGQLPNISDKMEALNVVSKVGSGRTESRQTGNSRPNSRHRTTHHVDPGQPAPVDKLLLLKSRARIRFTQSAILISSEAGHLRWWSLYSAQKEMGSFYVPARPDESVLAMCSNFDDSLLVTGDTLGVIRCYDIREYCLQHVGTEDKEAPPPVVATWRAHDSALVSVQFIDHPAGSFVLTASTDWTARLWSAEGEFIGTFGQKTCWDLRHRSTWAHPRTPWSAEADELPEEAAVSPTEVTTDSKADLCESSDTTITTTMSEADLKSSNVNSKLSTFSLNVREKSFISPLSTFLGARAGQDLMRRQHDRKERRALFGDVSHHSTAQYGENCSPYHALTPPPWQDVEIPTNLPLPHQMSSPANSEDHLQSLYFSELHSAGLTRGQQLNQSVDTFSRTSSKPGSQATATSQRKLHVKPSRKL